MRLALALTLSLAIMAGCCACATAAERLTIFDIPIGADVTTLPAASAFRNFACGNNGIAHGIAIDGWGGYSACPQGPDGTYEVYFEYNDAAERLARASGDYATGWFAGTAIDAFPVVTSVLFDHAGRVVGLRIVTDPRPEHRNDPFLHIRPRQEHYLLWLYLLDRFGMTPNDCQDREAVQGEGAVFGMYVNKTCAKSSGDVSYQIESRLYRRAGERDIDPATGQPTEGAFVSETRVEIRATGAGSKGTPPHPAPAPR